MSAPGGGQKVRLLKSALDSINEEDKIILFVDRYLLQQVIYFNKCMHPFKLILC